MSKVHIIYKSGAEITVTCDQFKTKTLGGELTSIEWENVKPRPLHMGIGEIAAIWEIK